MRRLVKRSSELFKVPREGLRALWADRRFRWALAGAAGVLLTAMLAIACALQFWLFPRINDYREDLAARAGAALGVVVDVGRLHGEWSYLHPRFVLDDVVVFDAAHRPAVQISQIGVTLSWWDMLRGNLGFRNLSVTAPALDFRRDKDGHLFLAGLPLDGGGDFRADAILEQGDLQLRSARVSWTDALRGAPPLALRDVTLRLHNRGGQHQLDVDFAPPEALGAPFHGRMHWIGRHFAEWRDWQIGATLKMDVIDLAGWRAWVDYPVKLSQGRGSLNLKLESTGLDLTHAEGLVALTDLRIRLARDLNELALQQAHTRLVYQKRDAGRQTQLTLNDFSFTDAQGRAEPPADIFVEYELLGGTPGVDDHIEFRASRLDLGRLRSLAMHLPIPAKVHGMLAKTQPTGVLKDVKAMLRLQNDEIADYDAQGAFKGLSGRSEDGTSFVRNLTGKLDVNRGHGNLVLDSTGAVLATPGILPVNEVPLTELSGKISWQRDADALSVKVKSLQLRNDDLTATVNGRWSGKLGADVSERDRAGHIDMKILFDEAKTTSAWKYVPLSASPDISAWMKGAIADGSVSDFRIEMAGPVWDMPYGSPVPGSAPGSSEATGVDGKFFLGFKTKDLTVKYAEAYPPLKKLDATFAMNQNRISIVADDGMINDMHFTSIKAEMDDVSALENHLLIAGQANGPTESVVRFLRLTPVADQISHFADTFQAEGNGKLDLTLDLNLVKLSDIKLQGKYTFINNRLTLLPTAPALTAVNGSIGFTESSMSSTDLQSLWSGEPLALRIATDAQGTKIEASGRASIADLRQFYELPLFDQISGRAQWQARVTVAGGQTDLSVTSDLRGVTSSLPEPFNKSASTALPLSVTKQTVSGGRRPAPGIDQLWRVSLGNALAGTLGMNSRGQPVRGRVVLGSGQVPTLNQQPGIQLESLRPVNLDYWMRAFGLNAGRAGATKATAGAAPTTWTLRAPAVTAFGRSFQDLRATVQSAPERTTVQLNSRELQGDVDWIPPGRGEGGERGLLQGRLSRLDLTVAADAKSTGGSAVESLPDFSFRVDELLWQGTPWGRLNFRARNQRSATGESWRVDPFQLDGPDLKFSGRLNWVTRNSGGARRTAPEQMTALDFKLDSQQVGNLLTRLGFPGTVKRGTAQMEGQVSWPANPFGFDPGKLSGNFKLSARDGQFAKMDPGVGRLLGLLSLQMLPQRLSLDFRDIFSSGLAFESIKGTFDIRDGVMKTSDLEMDAPAALVLMRGEANLAEQTQDVRVTVRPAVSNSVALGVTIVNPIAGAATFLAQRVLGDPLSRLFSYQYHITGTWANPLVDNETPAPAPASTATPAVRP